MIRALARSCVTRIDVGLADPDTRRSLNANRDNADDAFFDDDLVAAHRVTSRLRNTLPLMILYGSPLGGTISRS